MISVPLNKSVRHWIASSCFVSHIINDFKAFIRIEGKKMNHWKAYPILLALAWTSQLTHWELKCQKKITWKVYCKVSKIIQCIILHKNCKKEVEVIRRTLSSEKVKIIEKLVTVKEGYHIYSTFFII